MQEPMFLKPVFSSFRLSLYHLNCIGFFIIDMSAMTISLFHHHSSNEKRTLLIIQGIHNDKSENRNAVFPADLYFFPDILCEGAADLLHKDRSLRQGELLQ